MNINIRELKKIDGRVVQLTPVPIAELKSEREDCRNHIVKLQMDIDRLTVDKKHYEDSIDIINNLLRKEPKHEAK